jgi:hypothetical protein
MGERGGEGRARGREDVLKARRDQLERDVARLTQLHLALSASSAEAALTESHLTEARAELDALQVRIAVEQNREVAS